MKMVKVTSKGQVTIPTRVRTTLGISDDSYLEVSVENDEIHLRKVVQTRSLGDGDPIWGLVGTAAGEQHDVAQEHDRYLASSEIEQWQRSS